MPYEYVNRTTDRTYNNAISLMQSLGITIKEILDAMPAVEETQYVRHVRFEHPMRILMDGKKQEGAVLIPKE